MKKFFILLFIITASIFLNNSDAQDDINRTYNIWKIFASGSFNFESGEAGQPHQIFFNVRQDNNRFYWGDENTYTVYNKRASRNGFYHMVTWDFIDKYNQRGVLMYSYKQNGDWYDKHCFFIMYEGQYDKGQYYNSSGTENK